jgi:hypothetical protein
MNPIVTFFLGGGGSLQTLRFFFLSVLDTLYLTNIVSATVLVYLLKHDFDLHEEISRYHRNSCHSIKATLLGTERFQLTCVHCSKTLH